MKYLFSIVLSVVIPVICAAQNDRVVNGVVLNEHGAPMRHYIPASSSLIQTGLRSFMAVKI